MLIVAILIVVMVLVWYFVFAEIKKNREAEQAFIEKHKKIRLGMTKKQVIFIVGSNYTKSSLKNGIEKLEWKYRHEGYTGRITRGVYVHKGAVTRSMSVKFKDDVVIEVNCQNMDMI